MQLKTWEGSQFIPEISLSVYVPMAWGWLKLGLDCGISMHGECCPFLSGLRKKERGREGEGKEGRKAGKKEGRKKFLQ